jgi:hypothetical protein
MTFVIVTLVSLWAGVYTGALARAYWKTGNRRAGVGAGLLALLALTGPPAAQLVASTF